MLLPVRRLAVSFTILGMLADGAALERTLFPAVGAPGLELQRLNGLSKGRRHIRHNASFRSVAFFDLPRGHWNLVCRHLLQNLNPKLLPMPDAETCPAEQQNERAHLPSGPVNRGISLTRTRITLRGCPALKEMPTPLGPPLGPWA